MKKSGGFTYLGLAAALAAWYNDRNGRIGEKYFDDFIGDAGIDGNV